MAEDATSAQASSPGPRPGPAEEGGAAAGARADLAQRTVASEARRELAVAFRATAEALEGVRALQGEVVTLLKRQDRSELVLQSTQALNESFRNLARIQRALLERLEGGGRGAGAGRLLPLMMIVLLAVFLGGIYLTLDVLDELREERGRSDATAARGEAEAVAAYREGRAEGAAAAEEERRRLERQLADVQEREEEARRRMEDSAAEARRVEDRLRGVERERDALAADVLGARGEALARQALEDEVRELTARLAVVEPRTRELEADLVEARSEAQRLRLRLAAIGRGLEESGGERAASSPPEPEVRPASSPAPEGRVDRDPQLLARIRDRLNQMLTASGRGGPERWQVARLDGVSPEALHDVTLLRYDATGRLLDELRAEEVEIHVDRDRRQVEIECRGGVLVFQGSATPFAGGRIRRVVAQGEMTRLWSQSGLLFVKTR